jgi:hypothetical protein
MPYLVVMMGATFALWLVATVRHLVEAGPTPVVPPPEQLFVPSLPRLGFREDN